MPQRALKPCNALGCRELTTGRFCDKHSGQERQEVRHYDQHVRDKRSAHFYKSSAWQAARRSALMRDNYLCQECLKDKRIVPAHTVHHKTELSQDWSKRLRLDNLVSLCPKCHSEIHGKGRAGQKT